MTLEILNTQGKDRDISFEGHIKKVAYGTLAIDSKSILDGKFYSDTKWLNQFKAAIEKYFPQFCEMTQEQILQHPDLPVLKAFIKHQQDWYHKPFYRTSNESFDHSYNPEHYFAYTIPERAIAS